MKSRESPSKKAETSFNDAHLPTFVVVVRKTDEPEYAKLDTGLAIYGNGIVHKLKCV